MKIKYLATILLFLIQSLSWAQHDAPIRIELETAKDHDDFHSELVGTHGAFVFYETAAATEDSTSWIFINYDTNLQKNYIFALQLPALTTFSACASTENFLYILFQKSFPKKEPVKSFLMTIDLNAEKYRIDTLSELKNGNINKLVANDECLAAIAITNKQDSIYFFHQEKYDLFCLGNIFPYKYEFCVADTFNQRWLIGLKEYQSNDAGEIFLCEYEWANNKADIRSFLSSTPSKGDYIYNSANAIVINKDTTLLMGTYNTLQDRYSTNLHSGVYTILLHDFEFDSTRFYNYTQLKAANDGQYEKLKGRNLNLQLLIGNTGHTSKQFSFITEVYYPEYDYNYNTYDNFYGAYTSTPQQTFVGYRFINAYVTTFNRKGELIWDHYIPLTNIITKQLYRRVCIDFQDENAIIFYPKANHLFYTLVNGYETIEKMETMSIETNFRQDAVDYNIDTRLEHWYGDNYVASGYQYIINKGKGAKGKRYVFFMNKLVYE